MLLISLPVNSRLLVDKFWEESKVIQGFSTVQWVGTPTPTSFNGQLYPEMRNISSNTFFEKILWGPIAYRVTYFHLTSISFSGLYNTLTLEIKYCWTYQLVSFPNLHDQFKHQIISKMRMGILMAVSY